MPVTIDELAAKLDQLIVSIGSNEQRRAHFPNAQGDILDRLDSESTIYLDQLSQSGMDAAELAGVREKMDALMPQTIGRLDAGENIFFARQLEMIEATLYQFDYPELKGRMHFPISFEGGNGINEITFYRYDRLGRARLGTDFPEIGLSAKADSIRIKTISDSYGWDFQEVRFANQAGLNLDSMKALAARRAMMEEENRLIYMGDEETGLVGAFTHPNIPILNAGADILDRSNSPQDIEDVFTDALCSLFNLSLTVMTADTMLMPHEIYKEIRRRPYSTTGDESHKIYTVLQETFPEVSFDYSIDCAQASPDGFDILYAYKKSPQYMEVRIPSDFNSFPPRVNDKERTKINCEERFGGCQFRTINAVITELPSQTTTRRNR